MDVRKLLGSALLVNDKDEWTGVLSFIVLAVNRGHHKALGVSPCFLLFGHADAAPLDLIHLRTTISEEGAIEAAFPPKAAAYAAKLVNRLAEAFKIGKENWTHDIEYRSKAYSSVPLTSFKYKVEYLCSLRTDKRIQETN